MRIIKVYGMKYYLCLLFLVIFTGCKDNSLFIKKITPSDKPIQLKTISFKTDNYYLLDKVERSFKKYGFNINDGKITRYHIKITSHYVVSCKNPVVHALGADFNGYIRLSFFKDKSEMYKIQKDFRSKVTNEMIDGIVKRLIKDMKLSPSK